MFMVEPIYSDILTKTRNEEEFNEYKQLKEKFDKIVVVLKNQKQTTYTQSTYKFDGNKEKLSYISNDEFQGKYCSEYDKNGNPLDVFQICTYLRVKNKKIFVSLKKTTFDTSLGSAEYDLVLQEGNTFLKTEYLEKEIANAPKDDITAKFIARVLRAKNNFAAIHNKFYENPLAK